MIKDILKIGGCYPNYKLKKYEGACVNDFKCEEPVIDSLICYIETFNKGLNPSLIEWQEATNIEHPLKDYWLNGVDNGFSEKNEIYSPSHFPFTEFKNVSGLQHSYYMEDDTYLRGGFFQTSFKFENYNYQTLPDQYPNGWTIELDIFPEKIRIENSLNLKFPNNSNFIFYWGLRQENKFTMPLADYYGEYNNNGDCINPTLTDLGRQNNAFDSYNSTNTPNTRKFKVNCDEIASNGFGIRITEDNALQIRYIVANNSVDCGKSNIVNLTTEKNIIQPNEWQRVSITYKPNKYKDCISDFGELKIYIDGFLKYTKNNFPNLKFQSNSEPFSKKIGITHNISVGGGTLGLLETPSSNIPIDIFTDNILHDYEFSTQTNSIRIDEILYEFTSDITIDALKSVFPKTIGCISIDGDVVKIQNTANILNEVNGLYPCFKSTHNLVKAHPKYCGIIEQNFAGSFIGGIRKFKIHNRKLTTSEIRCNINVKF